MSAEPIALPGLGHQSGDSRGWWRNGVVHQVCVRSFQGSEGDGIGDLGGSPGQWYLHTLAGVDR